MGGYAYINPLAGLILGTSNPAGVGVGITPHNVGGVTGLNITITLL